MIRSAVPAPGRRKPGSYGLLGMQQRAAAMGGEIAISSSPRKGTVIEINVPRSARQS